MNNADIKQALQELEPEEAADIALDFLRGAGYVIKAWQPDDMDAYLGDVDDEDERARIKGRAENSRYWDALADCTEQEWELVSQAVWEART